MLIIDKASDIYMDNGFVKRWPTRKSILFLNESSLRTGYFHKKSYFG